MKKLIVFDLDGTLAESKSALDSEMAALLGELLGIVKVAIISGGDFPQFEHQVLTNLEHDEQLRNLSLLPTCGTKFYRYESGWKKAVLGGLQRGPERQNHRFLQASRRVLRSSGSRRRGASRLKTAAARSRSPRSASMPRSRRKRSGIRI